MNAIVRFSFLSALLFAFSQSVFADGVDIYNTIPNPLPPNVPSLGYEATGTSEFGGLIQFAGGNSYSLTSATVAMSDWALASGYTSSFGTTIDGVTITASGFDIPLTLNIYSAGAGGPVGSLIASDTVDAFIPWRPAPGGGSCTGTSYEGSDGKCYNGSLSTVTFDLTGLTVPGQVIYGLAFNTTHYGASPTGIPGPYESLNLGLSTVPPTVGSNPLPATAYWNTTNAGDYADGGAGGVGTFRQDQNWAPYSGAIEFMGNPISAPAPTPEPSSMLLFATGLLSLAGIAFRKIEASA
jgi:hypothetical protein